MSSVNARSPANSRRLLVSFCRPAPRLTPRFARAAPLLLRLARILLRKMLGFAALAQKRPCRFRQGRQFRASPHKARPAALHLDTMSGVRDRLACIFSVILHGKYDRAVRIQSLCSAALVSPERLNGKHRQQPEKLIQGDNCGREHQCFRRESEKNAENRREKYARKHYRL